MTAHLPSWQKDLAAGFSNPEALLQYLKLDFKAYSAQARDDFSMRVPLSYAACMQKGEPSDPLLMQVLPIADELNNPVDFQDDPVGDLAAITENCIIHKYQGRVLLIITGGCAINCRFCFRRNFPYANVQLNTQKEGIALNYIRGNSTIHEVILSGGDPLLLSDQRLKALLQKLSSIAHIKRIRIHTRLPIVLSTRVTTELIRILNNLPIPVIMVMHCNHAHELSEQVITACLALKQPNITLLNQSVLLKGINDNAQVLQALSEKLFTTGVLPYYLHLLDKAKGTAHFEMSQIKAIKLHQKLQQVLPGYLVPKLVKEQQGEVAKTLII
ncbi:L-lysine 2,3-aminomutase [Bathymodiolus japonicus methanotrophic gill symbiont]|uniref:EF-P beta-lysylation protein EpmB n=1 Tax=Bathymodiolus japonicus methanotrophic gill symbiont TaxID=113269 RepID=UPI001B4DDB4A|nr:EF-P beta-lysylation protein EpmB [Bathymodiolus japonicus methanotrophic gill symbiont]GFO73143.1 L-lysine 2,3-aminomutase [Bathymodiolus japonicus methanotrophic gill symbiont]